MLAGLSVSWTLYFIKNIGAETNHLFEAATRYGSTEEAPAAFHQKAGQELSMESIPNQNSHIIIWTRPWKGWEFVVSWIWLMPAENLISFEDLALFWEKDKKSFFHGVHKQKTA